MFQLKERSRPGVELPTGSSTVRSQMAAGTDPIDAYIRSMAFKRVFDQVNDAISSRNHSTVAVLSPRAGDGRTIFTAALATGYARLLGKKVLVVDAASSSGTPGGMGATLEILSPDRPSRPASAAEGSVQVKNLKGTGSGSVSEWDLRAILDDARDHYGIVFVDTCPLDGRDANIFDPVIIARQCDGALLLVASGDLTSESVTGLSGTLTRGRVGVLGIITAEANHAR